MNNIKKHLTLFVILIINSTSIYSQAWEQELNKNNITVWTRKLSWSAYKEFKAETTINSTLSDILSVFDDISNYPSWVYNCISTDIISKESIYKGTVYIAIKAPWPVSDRDMVYQYSASQNATTKAIIIRMKAIKSNYPIKGKVRMTFMIGSYELIPIAKNKVKVVYQSHNDPSGEIPKAIVNKMITDTPYNTLLNLRTLVESKKFKKQIYKEVIEF